MVRKTFGCVASFILCLGFLITPTKVLKAFERDSSVYTLEKQLEFEIMQTQLLMQQGHFIRAIDAANKLLAYTLDTRFLTLQARLQDILAKSFSH